MTTSPSSDLYEATSLEDAVRELARLGADGAPFGGGTWIMRAPLRGERLKSRYVSLRRIEGLSKIDLGDVTVLGALVTHARIGNLTTDCGALGALAEAARRSAFPAVRNVATLGGNICASPFPEADLVPPLLAADARLELVSERGVEALGLASYLRSRGERPPGEVLVSVSIPAPPGRRSSYERLTVLGAGEYPIVSVALSVDLDEESVVRNARVAVGSVEEVARRCETAEAELRGERIDASLAELAGRAAASELSARDGLDAPGWYRLAVLPALLRRAANRIVGPRPES